MAEIKEITPYGLTVQGATLQTKIQSRKIPLEFLGVAIGDGYLPDNQPFVETAGGKLIDIDSLIHEIPSQTTAKGGTRPTADIAAVYDTKDNDGNPLCMFNTVIQNGNNETTHIREFIVYANDPDEGKIAYSYTNLGDSGMSFPTYDGKVHVSYDWDFPTYISNAANVNANITLVAGTPRDMFNNHVTKSDIHTPIYFGDTEPDSDTYLWFAPVDSIVNDGEKEIILNAVDYTGDESKLHVETTEGKLYTVDNSTVTEENGETVVTLM